MEKKKKVKRISLAQQKQNSGLSKKRFLSFIIDWIFTAFLINIIIVFGRTLQLGEVTRNNYLPSFDGNSGYIYGTICLIACFLYMVVLPWKSKRCQTLGKRATHIEIVNSNGGRPSFTQLALRFLVILLFEPALYNFSLVLFTMGSMATGIQLHTTFTIVYWAITIISLILGATNKFGGMFHERFGKVQIVVD